jgi:hypothetical protein
MAMSYFIGLKLGGSSKSHEQGDEMFPPDRGFLKNNEITSELKKLKNLLDYSQISRYLIRIVYHRGRPKSGDPIF